MSEPTTVPITTKRHDIVIVGAGPSAMGLIFGLLSPFDHRFSKNSNDETAKNSDSSSPEPNFTIAVIERGPFSCRETKTSTSKVYNDAKKDPSMWFRTAHDERSRDKLLLRTVPQRGMNGRILEVPIGGGLGGGSNINACLAVPPSIDDFNSWPEQWTNMTKVEDHETNMSKMNDTTTSSTTTISTTTSKSLPRIMTSVKHIEHILSENDALYIPSDSFRVISQSQNGRQATCSNEHYWTKNKLNHSEFVHVRLPRDENSSNHDYPFNIQKMRFTARKNVKDDDKHSAFLRVNYYEGLLEPLLKANPHLKKYITFYTHTEAQKLIIESSKEHHNQNMKHVTEKSDPWVAKGVQCLSRGVVNDDSNTMTLLHIMADKKVILCTGAILSPVLLMMSGIGAKEELLKACIEPLGDSTPWTGVGKNLQDHLVMMLGYATIAKLFREKSVNALRGYIGVDIISESSKDDNVQNSSKGAARNTIKTRVTFNIMDGTRFHTMVPSFVAFAFHRKIQMKSQVVSHITNYVLYIMFVVIRWALTTVMNLYPIGSIVDYISAQILVGFLNLKSRGQVYITKRENTKAYDCRVSIFDQVDIGIHPDYLSDEHDTIHIEDTWQVLRKYIVPRLFKMEMMEIIPRRFFRSSTSFARNLSFPFYHWMGTCCMESKDRKNTHYVVDKNLKVRNIHSLYICDASVIPSSGLSAPPSLTLAALGFTAASIMNMGMDQYKMKKG
jgi:choline dehydrogenase-like flavoprotein